MELVRSAIDAGIWAAVEAHENADDDGMFDFRDGGTVPLGEYQEYPQEERRAMQVAETEHGERTDGLLLDYRDFTWVEQERYYLFSADEAADMALARSEWLNSGRHVN